jgi:membrane protein required for colicin V production
MIWVDYVLLIVVAVSVFAGVLRGLVREVLSLVAWIFAFVLSLRYAPPLDHLLHDAIHSPVLRYAVSYLGIFVGVLVIGALIVWLISLVVRRVGLSGVDRMLGAGFGLARGIFIVVAAVLLVGSTVAKEEDWWHRSVLIPKAQPLAEDLRHLIPEHWLAYLRPGRDET